MLDALPHLVLLPSFSQPFKLVILIVHIWLYSEQYRGALFLSQLIKQKIKEFALDDYIKLVYADSDI